MRGTHSLMQPPKLFNTKKGGFSGRIRFRRKQPNGECVPPPAHGGPRRAVPPPRRRRQPPPTRPPRPSGWVIGMQRLVFPSHFCWRFLHFPLITSRSGNAPASIVGSGDFHAISCLFNNQFPVLQPVAVGFPVLRLLRPAREEEADMRAEPDHPAEAGTERAPQ